MTLAATSIPPRQPAPQRRIDAGAIAALTICIPLGLATWAAIIAFLAWIL